MTASINAQVTCPTCRNKWWQSMLRPLCPNCEETACLKAIMDWVIDSEEPTKWIFLGDHPGDHIHCAMVAREHGGRDCTVLPCLGGAATAWYEGNWWVVVNLWNDSYYAIRLTRDATYKHGTRDRVCVDYLSDRRDLK